MDDRWDPAAVARSVGIADETWSVRDAAIDVDRAGPSSVSSERERAFEMWQELLKGRWRLIDSFEAKGRRFFVVTKSSAPGVERRLSQRERQVAELAAAGHPNKLISFELGISAGSVASALSSALRKLGVRSRVELAQLAAVALLLARTGAGSDADQHPAGL